MLSIHKSVVIIISMFFLTGCVAPRTANPRVDILDSFPAPEISVTSVTSNINSGGLMEVQVTGVNYAPRYRLYEYSIEWLDQDGDVIKSIMSSWTPLPVYENSEFRFSAVAPKTSATDYKIKIRKGD